MLQGPVTKKLEQIFQKHGLQCDEHGKLICEIMMFVYDKAEEEVNAVLDGRQPYDWHITSTRH